MDAAGINEDFRKAAATSDDFTNDPCRERQRRSNDAYRNIAPSINDFVNGVCRSFQGWLNDARRKYAAAVNDGSTIVGVALPQPCSIRPTMVGAGLQRPINESCRNRAAEDKRFVS